MCKRRHYVVNPATGRCVRRSRVRGRAALLCGSLQRTEERSVRPAQGLNLTLELSSPPAAVTARSVPRSVSRRAASARSVQASRLSARPTPISSVSRALRRSSVRPPSTRSFAVQASPRTSRSVGRRRALSAAIQTEVREVQTELKAVEAALLKALASGPVDEASIQEVSKTITSDVAAAILRLRSEVAAVTKPKALPEATESSGLLAQISFLKSELAAAQAVAKAGAVPAAEPAEIDVNTLGEPRKSKIIMQRTYDERPAFIAAVEERYNNFKANAYRENAGRRAKGKEPIPIPETLLQFYQSEKEKKKAAPAAPAVIKPAAGPGRKRPCDRVMKNENDPDAVAELGLINSWVGAANLARRNALKSYVNLAPERIERARIEALEALDDAAAQRQFEETLRTAAPDRAAQLRDARARDQDKLRRYMTFASKRVQDQTDYAKVSIKRIETIVRENGSKRELAILLENLENTVECLTDLVGDVEKSRRQLLAPADFEAASKKVVAAAPGLANLFAARGPAGPAAAGAGPAGARPAFLSGLPRRIS